MSNDLKIAVSELTLALNPLASLAESMNVMSKAARMQADLQVIAECYTKPTRDAIYASFDKAKEAIAFADATTTLVVKRRSDQRTFEQYAAAHGDDEAKRAFTSDADLAALCAATKQQFSDLKNAHPILFRVYSYNINNF